QPQHAVHHRVAERDQGVNRPERESVDELLQERGHGCRAVSLGRPLSARGLHQRIPRMLLYVPVGLTVVMKTNFPFSIFNTTAGLTALRSLLIVIVPVTPWKSFVAERASRTLSPFVVPARFIASARIRAAS